MFDCLIARLYLQAIVLGDSDQSCVHIICLWVCVYSTRVESFLRGNCYQNLLCSSSNVGNNASVCLNG